MLKSHDLRSKTEQELLTQLKDLVKQLRTKSLEILSQKEKNFGLPRKLRKDIARLKTILGEKLILSEAAKKASTK